MLILHICFNLFTIWYKDLYKSSCDNRLTEIIERASADRCEAESLAKKYEEKYKQAGDVAAKLTIEEATFRDLQEKKMELNRAVVKMDREGDADAHFRIVLITSN
ncbi:hypothetical protein ACFX15_034192 [Malus domestica]|uniref:uncharacterized protein LOC126623933 n=1 Tax=Malus sylvestris TaxID=3752 RepID=UPI0021AC4A30|nr:uncharacterized protein LOC126623933 [Malus sylvestris]XP_050148867.1 uncharacterized protein LOC126623933 [Malus sylvestris]XP_050148868.1 uncharacterized protein LOC126623933 [Malus sylvestris]